jgi:hypothetical protein
MAAMMETLLAFLYTFGFPAAYAMGAALFYGFSLRWNWADAWGWDKRDKEGLAVMVAILWPLVLCGLFVWFVVGRPIYRCCRLLARWAEGAPRAELDDYQIKAAHEVEELLQ